MPRQSPFLAYFLLLSLAVFSWTYANPYYNWDILGYVAAARAFETDDPIRLHRETFRDLAEAVPPQKYAELTLGNHYRQVMSQDPEAFHQQMPFYRIRVIYAGLVHLLGQAGVGLYAATHLVSTLAAAAGLWLLYFAFRRQLEPALWYGYPLLALPLGVMEVARLSTPDALAFLATVAIIYLLVRESRWLFLALPLAILVRTDLLLFVLPVLGWAFFRLPGARAWAIASLLLTLGIYAGVNKFFDHYGWSTLFYFSFIQQSPRPAELAVQFGLKEYLQVLEMAWPLVVQDKALLAFLGLSLLALGLWFRPVGPERPTRSISPVGSASRDSEPTLIFLLLLSLGYVVVHFLLFPMIWERFFVGQYLIALAALLALISRRLAGPSAQGVSPGGW